MRVNLGSYNYFLSQISDSAAVLSACIQAWCVKTWLLWTQCGVVHIRHPLAQRFQVQRFRVQSFCYHHTMERGSVLRAPEGSMQPRRFYARASSAEHRDWRPFYTLFDPEISNFEVWNRILVECCLADLWPCWLNVGIVVLSKNHERYAHCKNPSGCRVWFVADCLAFQLVVQTFCLTRRLLFGVLIL